MDMPERCGVILLRECTLFPHGGLPLYIFEQRYRTMLSDALEGHCFFAVGNLLQDETEDPAECCAETGTVGLVRASRERDDGTSQLLLHGVMRVKFSEWHHDLPYPCASIEPRMTYFEPKEQAGAAMKTLRGSVEDAIGEIPEEVRNGVLSLIDRAENPELMTDIVAQQFVHDFALRQRLLEIDSAGERIPLICEYLRKAGGQG